LRPCGSSIASSGSDLSPGDPAGPPRIGRVEHPWGRELTGFGRPFGLAVEAEGGLLVTDMDLHCVFRFAPGIGRWQASDGTGWSAPREIADGAQPPAGTRGAGLLNGPHSVDRDGDVLVVCCYYGAAIVRLDEAGRRSDTLLAPLLAGPATALFDAERRLLVAEYAENAVLAATAQGDYLGRLGCDAEGWRLVFDRGTGGLQPSAAPGGFDRPHMARSLGAGIVVADTWNHRLQRFDRSGAWLGWIGAGAIGWSDQATATVAGTAEDALHAPVAIDGGRDGTFLVTDWGNERLLLFDEAGRPLGRLGTPLPLRRPYDARFSAGGYVVADSHNGRILIVDRLG
jgi:hypothetical protein